MIHSDIKATPHDRVDHPDRWIIAATGLLAGEGPAALTVSRLSRLMGESRGAFYWHFRDRAALCESVLDRWETRTTPVLVTAADGAGSLGEKFFRVLSAVLPGGAFDMALDRSVRAWGTADDDVAERVLAADLARRAALAGMFTSAGRSKVQARHRAHMLYLWLVAVGGHEVLSLDDLIFEIEPFYKVATGEVLDPATASVFLNRTLPDQRCRHPGRGRQAPSAPFGT